MPPPSMLLAPPWRSQQTGCSRGWVHTPFPTVTRTPCQGSTWWLTHPMPYPLPSQLALDYGIKFMETSAKANINVENVSPSMDGVQPGGGLGARELQLQHGRHPRPRGGQGATREL